ncbi:hypothetical protein BTHERMOSOX_1094 [Bathymodiolus thermophilus thioautotrophic gill symbiont]|uniref:Uncharacterized protein n=1 Tax=Bathymodiolus thermophilus thioautotrophic gill symbiont TaxID=2360 RepID=A0A3G3IMF5_9GAMM|nr:hypothetical protein [Bathymodiolus thermophilus thioautotrophic gill symbiont]AYQ57013.1 hypothetical protein MS2017_1321 [Bathymodiolus thermophilus thioautotrophic gill symbiont]SGZ59110.1 hypothetical protein BTHERMOSOX_1094 [Bathymodiolus thermophilus thioautotrophic gill symbiont]
MQDNALILEKQERTVGALTRNNSKNNTQNIKNIKAIEINKLNIRQQLTEWGVNKRQINTCLNNLNKKTMNSVITQTLNQPKNKKSNAGGCIYKILESAKQLQLQTQVKANEVLSCLKSFGLSNGNIEKAR